MIVLAGAGRGFCAGQDLAEVDLDNVDLKAILTQEYEPLIHAIVHAPMPVIAAVNATAAGAGANLALGLLRASFDNSLNDQMKAEAAAQAR